MTTRGTASNRCWRAGTDARCAPGCVQDLEEEVVDREALKKQSGSILDKATKKTKKRRNKKSA